MSPVRIQRRRTKGWRMPEGAVYVGRPTDWGNPWSVGDGYTATAEPSCDPDRHNGHHILNSDAQISAFVESPEQAIALFEWAWLTTEMRYRIRAELAGKDLACWCPLDQPCHADVLLEIANQVIATSTLPIPVTPTTPPSAYVEVLGSRVVVSSGRHVAGNIAFLVGIIDDQIMVLHGCPSEQEPVVPAAPSGFSPLAVVRLKPYQVCVQHGDIEVVS